MWQREGSAPSKPETVSLSPLTFGSLSAVKAMGRETFSKFRDFSGIHVTIVCAAKASGVNVNP